MCYIYIYIYIHTHTASGAGRFRAARSRAPSVASGAPGTFGKVQVGQREYAKSPSVKKSTNFAATPLVLTPFVPFRREHPSPWAARSRRPSARPILYYTIYYILHTTYYILHTTYYILFTIYYLLFTIHILYTIYTMARPRQRGAAPRSTGTSSRSLVTIRSK